MQQQLPTIMGLAISTPNLSALLGFPPATSGGYSGAPVGSAVAIQNNPPLPSKAPSPQSAVNADPKKRFSAEQESILKLLADGFLPVTIASTLGITESAISQQLANEDFKRELAARKQVTLGKYKALDDGYDRVEASLLAKLEQSAMFFSRPGEIVSALEKINKMKRRIGASDNPAASQQISQIVNISMPTVIARSLQITKEGRVVGVDNESIVTINSGSLNALVQEAQNVEEVKAIPGPR